MTHKPDKPLEKMTRAEKLAAGYRPIRCGTCAGAGKTWVKAKRRIAVCPQCEGARFFWVLAPLPRRTVSKRRDCLAEEK